MPTRKPPKEIDPKYLERAFIQVNVRVPLILRSGIDEYLAYTSQPEHRRPDNTANWPKSLSGLVILAIEDFLDSHPLQGKRGPYKPADYIKVKKTATKIRLKPSTETVRNG